MATTLGQSCTVYLDGSGVQRFKIESSVEVVAAGDLPSPNIFVNQIVSPNDPKADIFLRVGTVADLTTLPWNRDTAVARSQTLFLSSNFTVIYTDVATASTAKLLIQQRVDNIIADWHTYNDQFLSPLTVPPNLSEITFPLTTALDTARKAAYATAHAELLAAQAVTASAQVAVISTATAVVAANEAAVSALADSQTCSSIKGQLTQGLVAFDKFRSDVAIFAAAALHYAGIAVPGGSDVATFNAAYSQYITALTSEGTNGGPVLTGVQNQLAVACTNKIADVATSAQKKSAADAAAASATTKKAAADAEEAAAMLADASALLSVRELCPDFVATSP